MVLIPVCSNHYLYGGRRINAYRTEVVECRGLTLSGLHARVDDEPLVRTDVADDALPEPWPHYGDFEFVCCRLGPDLTPVEGHSDDRARVRAHQSDPAGDKPGDDGKLEMNTCGALRPAS